MRRDLYENKFGLYAWLLDLQFIKYCNENISDFFNNDTLDIIINGGVLCFDLTMIDKENQQQIIDKINYIKNKFYYNNNFFEVNKLFKIIILSKEECNLNIFVKLDYSSNSKRRIT